MQVKFSPPYWKQPTLSFNYTYRYIISQYCSKGKQRKQEISFYKKEFRLRNSPPAAGRTKRHFPIRRSAIHAEHFLLYRTNFPIEQKEHQCIRCPSTVYYNNFILLKDYGSFIRMLHFEDTVSALPRPHLHRYHLLKPQFPPPEQFLSSSCP